MSACTALRGSFTALITPFTADGTTVDLDRLGENLKRQADAGMTGVVPCGTTAETPTLSDAEYRAVITRTMDFARPLGLTVIAGAGANSTAHALELHRFAASSGADAALQVVPYYNKPSQDGIYRHFMTLADAVDLPIVLYNVPGRTGVAMSIDTITRLAAHPNVVAIKDATGGLDFAYETVERTDLVLLSGDDPLTLPMSIIGGSGVISVVGNVVPDQVAALCRACADGAWDDARAINRTLVPLARALLSLDVNPVPVKAALQQMGLDTGAVRLPLAPAAESTCQAIAELLDAATPSAAPPVAPPVAPVMS